MTDAPRLPHAGLARMIVSAGRTAPDESRCVARVPLAHPCVTEGRVPAAVLLELGAQAAAATDGASATGGEVRAAPGRVVALKALRWDATSVPAGADLEVRVRLVETAPPLRNYAFEVDGLGAGVVSVWLEAAPEAR